MALPALVLAWLLSVLPVALPALGVDLELDHPVALVLLVWLALAGLPRARTASARQPGARPLAAAALALAPLAAALAGERALRGSPPSAALAPERGLQASLPISALDLATLTGWVLVLLLAAGAARAAGERRHGITWLVLVPGLPLAAAGLGWASSGGRGAAPRWLAWLADQSPLHWAQAWLVGEPQAASAVGPLAVAVLLWLLARADGGTVDSERRTEDLESLA